MKRNYLLKLILLFLFGCSFLITNNILNSKIIFAETELEFKLLADDTYSVSINNPNSKELIIPDLFNNKIVTKITSGGFANNIILEKIEIPSSIISIETGAFKDCTNLKSIIFNEGLLLLSNYAFQNCTSLTEITLPNSVYSIGNYAFKGCSSLQKVTLTKAVKSIGQEAFGGCSNLKEMVLPFIGGSRKNVDDINQYPLGYIFGKVSYTNSQKVVQSYYGLKKGVISNATYYIPKSLTNISILDGIINYGAFSGCTMLTDVKLEEGITSIEEKAFDGCTSLNFIHIPSTVVTVQSNVFNNCNNLLITLDSIEVPLTFSKNWNNDRPILLLVCDHKKGGEWKITTPPTCFETGVEELDCSICGQHLTRQIEHLDHTLGEIIEVFATCTSEGKKYQMCSSCEYVVIHEIIPLLGHDLIHHEALDATCETDGHTEYDICTRCEYTTYEKIDSLGHDIIIIPETTEKTEGLKCDRCGEIIKNPIIKASCFTSSLWLVASFILIIPTCLFKLKKY